MAAVVAGRRERTASSAFAEACSTIPAIGFIVSSSREKKRYPFAYSIPRNN
jgi:hypothetical protein